MDLLNEAKNAVYRPIELETGGASRGLKRLIRSIAFKALRPFISNQQAINTALLNIVESQANELEMRRAGLRADAIQTTELLREIRRLNTRIESLQELISQNSHGAQSIKGETNQ